MKYILLLLILGGSFPINLYASSCFIQDINGNCLQKNQNETPKQEQSQGKLSPFQDSINNSTPMTTEEKSVVDKLFGHSNDGQLSPCNSKELDLEKSEINYMKAGNQQESANSYVLQGTEHACNNDFVQAILDFNKAIGISSKTGAAYEGRAEAFYFQNNYDQAITDFTKAIGLPAFEKDMFGNPGTSGDDDSTIYYMRGIVYYVKGNYAQAMEDFNKAIQMMPNGTGSNIYYFRGRTYDHLGNHDLATNNYEQALNIEHQINSQLIATNIQTNNSNGSQDGVNNDIEGMLKNLQK